MLKRKKPQKKWISPPTKLLHKSGKKWLIFTKKTRPKGAQRKKSRTFLYEKRVGEKTFQLKGDWIRPPIRGDTPDADIVKAILTKTENKILGSERVKSIQQNQEFMAHA